MAVGRFTTTCRFFLFFLIVLGVLFSFCIKLQTPIFVLSPSYIFLYSQQPFLCSKSVFHCLCQQLHSQTLNGWHWGVPPPSFKGLLRNFLLPQSLIKMALLSELTDFPSHLRSQIKLRNDIHRNRLHRIWSPFSCVPSVSIPMATLPLNPSALPLSAQSTSL